MNTLKSFDKLNKLLLEWNMSDKSQRFGQYIESNSSVNLDSKYYNCEDSYDVYCFICSMIEKGFVLE